VREIQDTIGAHNVFGRIADHKVTRIDELLPWRHAAAAA
jgi:hypothetical protein